MEKRNLARRCEIADVDDVDVAAGRDADCTWPFLADERVTLLSVEGVVKPPDVVSMASNRYDVAQHDGIRNSATSHAANIPDRDSLIPESRDENSISYVDVMHVRAPHRGSKNLSGCGRIGQIDDHETSGTTAAWVDAKESV